MILVWDESDSDLENKGDNWRSRILQGESRRKKHLEAIKEHPPP